MTAPPRHCDTSGKRAEHLKSKADRQRTHRYTSIPPTSTRASEQEVLFHGVLTLPHTCTLVYVEDEKTGLISIKGDSVQLELTLTLTLTSLKDPDMDPDPVRTGWMQLCVSVCVCPHIFKGLFGGESLVLRLGFELGLGQGRGQCVSWDG